MNTVLILGLTITSISLWVAYRQMRGPRAYVASSTGNNLTITGPCSVVSTRTASAADLQSTISHHPRPSVIVTSAAAIVAAEAQGDWSAVIELSDVIHHEARLRLLAGAAREDGYVKLQ